jgi:hypothetical protein
MSDYQRLMMREQAAARGAYNFDPRVSYAKSRDAQQVIEPYVGAIPDDKTQIDPLDYDLFANQGPRGDPSIVQGSPRTRTDKRYVIIDASQRDWVLQPNPYTTLQYSFGSQTTVASNPPVYTNNPFVPTFAIEQQALSAPIPGLPNTGGWTLAAAPSNIRYPPYNSSLLPGNFIAFDTGYLIKPSGSGFGSVFNASNIASLRLVRAVLPQRQFLNIAIDPSSSGVDASTSQFIQSNLIDKPYSTFSTYPYLLFNMNEFYGQYVGGNEPMRRSFSVMTQKQRQQSDFQTSVGVQQYDYEPWSEEALKFQSPITNLKRLEITVTDPIGTPFTQNDNLSISVVQASSNSMYLYCFTTSFQYFTSNELRVGDRVTFYQPGLSNILKSPLLAAQNTQKRDFVIAMLATTFPVLQLLDYVTDTETGGYVPRDASSARTTPYVASFNGFIIPNFITIGSGGNASPTYPQAIDEGTRRVLETDLLINSNLPFLNTTLQPVYTLEIESVLPDTSGIGGTIVTTS